jgi:hypothetical protein
MPDDKYQTTIRPSDYGFPEPTPENRASIGCYAWPPRDYSGCWCGYHVIDDWGCCPQCQIKGEGIAPAGDWLWSTQDART